MRAYGANIQTAATKVTNIGDRLALAASVLPLSVMNLNLSGKYWLKGWWVDKKITIQ